MLLGNSIPEDDCVWRFFLLFLEVVDICCSPRLSTKSLLDLKMSLQCMFNEFERVHYPCKVIPKMHYLLFYPMLTKKLGPLVHFSCMRFEAKHKQMKRVVTKCNNFKNIPHTIATSHQNALAATLCSKDLFFFQYLTLKATRLLRLHLLLLRNLCTLQPILWL